VRELREELGIKVEAGALSEVCKLCPDFRTGFEFTQVFRLCSDQTLRLQEEEIDDGRWVMPEVLTQWIADHGDAFTEGFKLIWPRVNSASVPARL